MSNDTVAPTLFDSSDAAAQTAVEQLSLLDTSELPLQFRLDMATRRRGLAHVAEMRRLLAQRSASWAA